MHMGVCGVLSNVVVVVLLGLEMVVVLLYRVERLVLQYLLLIFLFGIFTLCFLLLLPFLFLFIVITSIFYFKRLA